MIQTIDHIGVAVQDLDAAVEAYSALLGSPPTHREVVPGQDVEVVEFQLADHSIELLAGQSEKSPVSKFVALRGPGQHHIALRVHDIDAALDRLREQGFRLVDEQPRPGARGTRIAFIHPKSAGGVLIELVERS